MHLMAHTLGDTATSGNKAALELTVFLMHNGLVPLVGNTMAEAPFRFHSKYTKTSYVNRFFLDPFMEN